MGEGFYEGEELVPPLQRQLQQVLRETAVWQNHDLQSQEMHVALSPNKSTDPQQREVWEKYNEIFTDAAAFAPQLTVLMRSAQFPIPENSKSVRMEKFPDPPYTPQNFREILEGKGDGPAEKACKDLMREFGYDVFHGFQGEWRGFWHQDGKTTENHHFWNRREKIRGDIDVQRVVIYGDSPEAGVNALNRNTGVIAGAVGEDRPHVGYHAGLGKLVWVAKEHEYGDKIGYSCFYEVSGNDEYSIYGCDFIWDITQQKITKFKTKGGRMHRVRGSAPPTVL